MLPIYLDETVAGSPNLIAPRGERDFRIFLGDHHSKISSSSQVGAANFKTDGDRVFTIPTKTGLGRRRTFGMNGKCGVAKGSRGISFRQGSVTQESTSHGGKKCMRRVTVSPRNGTGGGDSWELAACAEFCITCILRMSRGGARGR